jgi:hypothetical protein
MPGTPHRALSLTNLAIGLPLCKGFSQSFIVFLLLFLLFLVCMRKKRWEGARRALLEAIEVLKKFPENDSQIIANAYRELAGLGFLSSLPSRFSIRLVSVSSAVSQQEEKWEDAQKYYEYAVECYEQSASVQECGQVKRNSCSPSISQFIFSTVHRFVRLFACDYSPQKAQQRTC